MTLFFWDRGSIYINSTCWTNQVLFISKIEKRTCNAFGQKKKNLQCQSNDVHCGNIERSSLPLLLLEKKKRSPLALKLKKKRWHLAVLCGPARGTFYFSMITCMSIEHAWWCIPTVLSRMLCAYVGGLRWTLQRTHIHASIDRHTSDLHACTLTCSWTWLHALQ
jgi:hypothetical protein